MVCLGLLLIFPHIFILYIFTCGDHRYAGVGRGARELNPPIIFKWGALKNYWGFINLSGYSPPTYMRPAI